MRRFQSLFSFIIVQCGVSNPFSLLSMVEHRLYVEIYLGKLKPSLVSQQDVKSLLYPLFIKDQSEDTTHAAALSISQLLKFNSTKHRRVQDTITLRHSIAQETPVRTYIVLMLHAQTRKRELVDRLFHLGLSIPYDRIFRLTAQMGSNICEQFSREQVVCPPKLHGNVFTTAAAKGVFSKSSVPAASIKSLSRDTFKQHVEKEYI